MLAQIQNETEWQKFKRILPGNSYQQIIKVNIRTDANGREG